MIGICWPLTLTNSGPWLCGGGIDVIDGPCIGCPIGRTGGGVYEGVRTAMPGIPCTRPAGTFVVGAIVSIKPGCPGIAGMPG